jgi:site-specific recombinase XerD
MLITGNEGQAMTGELQPHTGTELTRHEDYGMAAAVSAFLVQDVTNERTRRAYGSWLRTFTALTHLEDVRHLQGAHLDGWAHYLREAGREDSGVVKVQVQGAREPKPGPYSPASRAQALVAVRSFLAWLDERHDITPVPEKVVRRALRVEKVQTLTHYNVLSDDESARLFAAAAHGRDLTRKADRVLVARDRALVAVLLDAGLRASEVVGLDVGDLHEDGDASLMLHVREGKGAKDRTVPVVQEVAQVLRHYLAATGRVMGDKAAGPLFTRADRGGKGGRLTARAVGMVLARLVKAAGVDGKRITPHALRHSFALRQARGGVAPHEVQELLGHASLATTTLYLRHADLDELREKMVRPAYAAQVAA